MSQSTSSAVSFTVHVARIPTPEELLLAEVRRRGLELKAMPSSRALDALAVQAFDGAPTGLTVRTPGPLLATVPSLQRLEARAAAVESTTGAEAFMSVAAGVLTSKANRLLQASRAALAARNVAVAERLGARGDLALREALTTTSDRVRPDERVLAAAGYEDSLKAMGFHTAIYRGARSIGVRGIRAHEVALGLAVDGPVLHTDYAGLPGGECRPVHSELTRHMTARGLVLKPLAIMQHGDALGGLLIHRASLAARDGRLEEGVVRQYEDPGSVEEAGSGERVNRGARVPPIGGWER